MDSAVSELLANLIPAMWSFVDVVVVAQHEGLGWKSYAILKLFRARLAGSRPSSGVGTPIAKRQPRRIQVRTIPGGYNCADLGYGSCHSYLILKYAVS